jgi:hypothetical protein
MTQTLIAGEFRDRLARHEAGHFLVGYCLGLPIEGYRANDAILNAVQFFPKTGGVAGRLTHTEVRKRNHTQYLHVSLS